MVLIHARDQAATTCDITCLTRLPKCTAQSSTGVTVIMEKCLATPYYILPLDLQDSTHDAENSPYEKSKFRTSKTRKTRAQC